VTADNSGQSGLERFFDIDKPVGVVNDRDSLGWEELKSKVTDNLDRARINKGSLTATRDDIGFSDSVGKMEVPKCLSATDCSSNFTCVNGQCVSWTQTAKDATSGGSGLLPTGGTTGSGTCDDSPQADCSSQNCSTPGNCGDSRGIGGCEITKPSQCCGGSMYRCPFSSCPQCEPCQEPFKNCTTYCDSFGSSFGIPDPSCEGKSCGECAECEPTGSTGYLYDDPYHCVPKEPGPFTPCNCSPENSGCPECEECQSDGECRPAEGQCVDNCNCFVKCPCGVTLQGTHSQEHYQNGPVCPSACRAKLYKQCDAVCPPKQDNCKADPNDPCEVSCECKTHRVGCSDGPPPCPSGKRCYPLGNMFAGTNEQGGCMEYNPATGMGGKYIFQRICTMSDSEECEPCDCHCENDCGECEVCSASGNCVYDPDCDDKCFEGEINCDGQCCPPGEQCVPQDCIEFTDACHNAHVKVCGPAGASFGLAHNADIPAESAVCNRFHTHCYITVNGVSTGSQHLDCQAGLPAPTKGTGFSCSGS